MKDNVFQINPVCLDGQFRDSSSHVPGPGLGLVGPGVDFRAQVLGVPSDFLVSAGLCLGLCLLALILPGLWSIPRMVRALVSPVQGSGLSCSPVASNGSELLTGRLRAWLSCSQFKSFS